MSLELPSPDIRAPTSSLEDLAVDRDELWSALSLLPTRQRTALVLRFYLDSNYADIAEHMSCRVATARSLVHRGLLAVRAELTRSQEDAVSLRRTSWPTSNAR